jgi:hypothetical protein
MQGQIQDLAGGTIGNLSIVTLGFYDRCRCFSVTAGYFLIFALMCFLLYFVCHIFLRICLFLIKLCLDRSLMILLNRDCSCLFLIKVSTSGM